MVRDAKRQLFDKIRNDYLLDMINTLDIDTTKNMNQVSGSPEAQIQGTPAHRQAAMVGFYPESSSSGDYVTVGDVEVLVFHKKGTPL